VITPPTMGAVMTFITLVPTPLPQNMGMRLVRTTHTVIRFGRKLWTTPSLTASSMSSCWIDLFPERSYIDIELTRDA
jgi:hypothetical protein